MLLKSMLLSFFSFYTLGTNVQKECESERDKISGCIERIYANGILTVEIPYKNGRLEGISKIYYENGNLSRIIPHKNNEAVGIVKLYYKNGNLQAEIPMLNNVLHGDLKFYAEDKKPLALLKTTGYGIISGKCHNGKALTEKDLMNINRRHTLNMATFLNEICSLNP